MSVAFFLLVIKNTAERNYHINRTPAHNREQNNERISTPGCRITNYAILPITRTPLVLPFEFIVTGKPVSYQTKDKKRLQTWKATVRTTAEYCWKAEPAIGLLLRVTITHYYDAPPGQEDAVPDSDNIVKPIRDALNGAIYVDDYQISDFVSRRRNLNGSFRIKGMSPVLAEGFCKGEEFLHILIEPAPDPETLN